MKQIVRISGDSIILVGFLTAVFACVLILAGADPLFSKESSVIQAPLASDPWDSGLYKPGDPHIVPAISLRGPDSLGPNGRMHVIIELTDMPTVKMYAKTLRMQLESGQTADPSNTKARAGLAARAQGSKIEEAQKELIKILRTQRIDIDIIYRVKRAYNGIAVALDGESLDQLRGLPGVKSVHPLIPQFPNNASSIPFIGSPDLWDFPVTGDGIRIGIIDTGVDYIHTNFGGTGSSVDYTANDITIIETPGPFPNAKVIGGYDFAGDDYNPSDPDHDIPVPDPDPFDVRDHGTHVAGTAAGYGVNLDGSTYVGSYNSGISFGSLRIGPGVAPESQIYALKVFGREGSTFLTPLAVDWAVDPDGDGDPSDHLDVINLSLGSAFGRYYDASAVACENAAEAGVVVVASAGNSGDTYYITGSPAVSTRTVSVASSVDDGIICETLQVNSPPGIAGAYAAKQAEFGPALSETGITSDLAEARPSLACDALTNDLTGKIALIDRGTCVFVTKVRHAQEAGAVAAVVINNVDDALFTMGDDGTGGDIVIPSVFISLADGTSIRDELSTGAVNVTLSNTKISAPEYADTISSFTSRGPRIGDSFLKPDIAAPGHNVTSALAGSGDGETTMKGTSQAAPHIAGGMALLRELHPSWTVEELKALIMNTATHDLYVGSGSTPPIYGPGRIGSGRVDLKKAMDANVICYNNDDPGAVSVSFGAVEVADAVTIDKTVRISNKGTLGVSCTLSYVPVTDVPGVTYDFPDGILYSVPAGGSINFSVQLSASDPNGLKHTMDETINEFQLDRPRFWLSEEAGYIQVNVSGGHSTLRLPVHCAPRPASVMTALNNPIPRIAGETVYLALGGQGIDTGDDYPTDIVSLVNAFELQEISPDDAHISGRDERFDLKYIGITSDYLAAGSLDASKLSFGIATYGKWNTPNHSEVQFFVFIDTDRDGADDYVVFNGDRQYFVKNGPNDVFYTILRDLSSGSYRGWYQLNGFSSSFYDTALYNTDVIMFRIPAEYLYLTNGASAFNYQVCTYDRWNEMLRDCSNWHTYDPANPGLDLTGGTGVTWFDLDGNAIPVLYDPEPYQDTGTQGILLLHHHNADGTRAEFVRLVEPCDGDFEPRDGDVDGSDLAVFAADFGRTDCGIGDPCEGDFDGGGAVDGNDLAVFAADFGRTDCPE